MQVNKILYRNVFLKSIRDHSIYCATQIPAYHLDFLPFPFRLPLLHLLFYNMIRGQLSRWFQDLKGSNICLLASSLTREFL